MLIEIDQSEGRQMLVVIHDAAIAHLGITEDALQNAKGPLHLGSNSRLTPVLALLVYIHALLGLDVPVGPILRCGRGLVNHLRLSLITRVAAHLLFLAVQ